MEPTEVIIARLVLGYLRNEHCQSAYKAFLGSSNYFDSQTKNKYILTRFVGLTLDDILNEYFEIYHIVQARLEFTSYFNERHSKTSLPDQLLYLLSKGHSISRTSTPCPRSPIDSHLDEASPCYQHPNSDVETTPAHTLPGNIQYSKEETYFQKTPRTKHKTNESPLDNSKEMAEVAVDTEVLAKTLLENKEFHEKIAQTINKVAEKQHKVCTGLDKTIETVVRETEEDPIFDKILEEIIGSTNIMDNKFESNATSSMAHSRSEVVDDKLDKSGKLPNVNDTSQVPKYTGIGVQNNEVIHSVVATPEIAAKNPSPCNRDPINNEVVVYDGSLDKYLVNNGCSIVTPPIQNQIYLNTMGFLIPTKIQRNRKPPTNIKYHRNYPQVDWNIPVDSVINQDILSMPTVIVSEKTEIEKGPKDGQRKVQQSTKPQHLPEIRPMPKIIVSVGIPETTVVDAQEPNTVQDLPEWKTGLKKVIYPKVTNSNLENNPAQLPPSLPNQPLSSSTPTCSKDLPDILSEEKDLTNSIQHTEIINNTPPPSENIQKVTPKSASHIRNLDFSTPPKITPSCSKIKRRTIKSPTKKHTSKSLFNKETQPKNIGPILVWDSDLRAGVSQPDTKDGDTPKRVTKRPVTKTNRKKAKTNSKQGLNTTEQDAAALEAALQSPIKVVNLPVTEENVKKHSGTTENAEKLSEGVALEVSKDTVDQSKTILSPSKLNASKRNLLDSEGDAKSKYITPENAKDNVTYPIKVNRNITTMLETPMKDYALKIPGIQTPGDLNISSMSSNMTPFTKMLEANLKCIDISQLPTPNLPITPHFPELTPIIDLVSPFSNRPTDYSTSSSYYQPSDNEQNKSLEAHLMEMEKCVVEKVDTRIEIKNEHLNNFNKNMVGKKNLNLVNRNIQSSSSSSDESGTDSGKSDRSSVDNKESNDTVICKKCEPESPVKTYCLRVRNTTGQVQREVAKKDLSKLEKDVNINKSKPKPVRKGVKKIHEVEETEVATTQKSVTKELEEKRLRVMNKLKSNKTKKPPRKNNKFMKIKPLVHVNAKKKGRKVATPKKITTPKKEELKSILMRDLEQSDDSDYEGPSNSSTNAKSVVTDRNEVTTSDVEAQHLIEGMKERGIYLMHNKSPKKKVTDMPPDTEVSTTAPIENKSLDRSLNEHIHADQNSFLSTEDRDVYDIQVFEQETVCLVYDEKNPAQRTFEDYNTKEIIEKTMKTQIFVEEVNVDIDINLRVSPFYTLLEIIPKENIILERIENQVDNSELIIQPNICDIEKVKGKQIKIIEDRCISKPNEQTCEESESVTTVADSPPENQLDDELMNYAVTGSDKEDMLDSSVSRKRKVRPEGSTQNVKKCKKMLKNIDVDVFLNNIHGNEQSEL